MREKIFTVIKFENDKYIRNIFLLTNEILAMCTPLNYCCLKLNRNNSITIKVFKLLLEAGADVNIPYNMGIFNAKTMPLRLACEYQNEEVVDLFLQYGADVNSKDFFGAGPAAYAAKKYSDVVVKMIRMGAPIEFKTASFDTDSLLYYAIDGGNDRLVEKLLDMGADPNVIRNDVTILMHACMNEEENIVAILLEHGILNINFTGVEGVSAVTYAIENDNPRLFKMLIDFGADIENVCSIEYAISLNMVKVLVSLGADINKYYSLMGAYINGRHDIYQYLESIGAERNIRSWEDVVRVYSNYGVSDFVINFCEGNASLKDSFGATIFDYMDVRHIKKFLKNCEVKVKQQ